MVLLGVNLVCMKNGPYELVLAPEDYPGKLYRGKYVYEHHLVWWKSTGNLVLEPMLIHHKNHQKRDNRFENLELQDRGLHSARHNKERSGPIQYVELECAWCRKTFKIEKRNECSRKKAGNNHCSRSCSVKHQWALGLGNGGRRKSVPL
jgi:hypothetical protein